MLSMVQEDGRCVMATAGAPGLRGFSSLGIQGADGDKLGFR